MRAEALREKRILPEELNDELEALDRAIDHQGRRLFRVEPLSQPLQRAAEVGRGYPRASDWTYSGTPSLSMRRRKPSGASSRRSA